MKTKKKRKKMSERERTLVNELRWYLSQGAFCDCCRVDDGKHDHECARNVFARALRVRG